MKEIKQIFKKEQEVGRSGIVDRWITDARPVLSIRKRVEDAVEKNNTEVLIKMGFPETIHPLMKLWNKKGPDILTSFSHPEEFDTYKLIGALQLRQFLDQVDDNQFKKPIIVLPYFDTVPVHKSAIKPLKVADIGYDINIFGVLDDKKVSSTSSLSAETIGNAQSNFEQKIPTIASELIKSLQGDIIAANKATNRGIISSEVLIQTKQLIEQRLSILLDIYKHAAPTSRRQPRKISRILMDTQQAIVSQIFANEIGNQSFETALGHSAVLASENINYLTLSRDSIKALPQEHCAHILKKSINPGEGLAVSINGGTRQVLSKNSEDNFTLRDITGREEVITTQQAMSFATSEMPLGKLEFIAMLGGGKTLHMGSEYNVRERIIDALGITGDAKNYVMNLRIGNDKEHGVEAIQLDGTETYVPLALLYVFFGEKGVKNILSENLTTHRALVMTRQQLRKSASESLVSAL